MKNDGIDDVLDHLYSRTTPTKEFVLPPGQKTAMSLAERVEELIREKLYRTLHREVPHSITQINRVLQKGRMKDGINAGNIVLRIDQDLVVKTKSHYKLVMGRGGMTLKRIHETARRDLLKTLRSEGYDDIILNLHVKLSGSKGHDRELEADRQGIMTRTFE